MASQEYEILEEFPELENVTLSDYTKLDELGKRTIRLRRSTRRP